MAITKKTKASAATKKPVKKAAPIAKKVSPAKKAPAKKVVAKKAPAKKVVAKKAPAKKVAPAKKAPVKLWNVQLIGTITRDVEGDVTKSAAGIRIVNGDFERFVPTSQVMQHSASSAVISIPSVIREFDDVISFKDSEGALLLTFEDGATLAVSIGGGITVNATRGEESDAEESDEEEEESDEESDEEEEESDEESDEEEEESDEEEEDEESDEEEEDEGEDEEEADDGEDW